MIAAINAPPCMNHPQRSSPVPRPAKPPLSRPDPATEAPVMGWLAHLLETRPMAFWSGIWVSTFLIGVVAFGSLLSPSASERRSVSAIALGSDSGVATQPLENRGKVPLWMFGAIAVTCTAGSILVSRQLKPASMAASPRVTHVAKPPRQRVQAPRPLTPVPGPKAKSRRSASPRRGTKRPPPKRLKPYSPGESLLPTQAFPVSPPAPPAIAATPATVRPPRPQPAPSPSFVVSKRVAPTAKPVSVTVVPAEQTHPLDWTEPRLTDDLDLRKQKPIQSWL